MYDFKILNYGNDQRLDTQQFIKEYGVTAMLMGHRQSDPYRANQTTIQNSSSDWGDYIVVSPILYWTYSDVW